MGSLIWRGGFASHHPFFLGYEDLSLWVGSSGSSVFVDVLVVRTFCFSELPFSLVVLVIAAVTDVDSCLSCRNSSRSMERKSCSVGEVVDGVFCGGERKLRRIERASRALWKRASGLG